MTAGDVPRRAPWLFAWLSVSILQVSPEAREGNSPSCAGGSRCVCAATGRAHPANAGAARSPARVPRGYQGLGRRRVQLVPGSQSARPLLDV